MLAAPGLHMLRGFGHGPRKALPDVRFAFPITNNRAAQLLSSGLDPSSSQQLTQPQRRTALLPALLPPALELPADALALGVARARERLA